MRDQASNVAGRIEAQGSLVVPAVLAILLGTFLLLGTGFVHSSTIHDAAHDSRHSFTFPCH
ncbi:MAG: cobalt transporter subunit [Alphaproteobacteria bacterium]|nr:cobalt transporter subunit [Alphaproteobacteria bacterium]